MFFSSQKYLTIHAYLSRYSLNSARTVGAKVQARAALCEYSRAKTQEMMYPASTDSLKLYSGSIALCGLYVQILISLHIELNLRLVMGLTCEGDLGGGFQCLRD